MKNRKKSVLSLLCLLGIFLFTLACSANPKSGTTNKKYNEKQMLSLTGQKLLLKDREDIFLVQDIGLGFIMPEIMQNLAAESLLEIVPTDQSTVFFTLYSASLHNLLDTLDADNMTQEKFYEFLDEMQKYAFNIAGLLYLPPEDKRTDEAETYEQFAANFSVVEKLAELDGSTYYLGYNTDYSDISFSNEEQETTKSLLTEIENFKKNIFVFPPKLEASVSSGKAGGPAGSLSRFEADTLSGEKINQNIFKDYKLTMINIWATWCGPCISEMPELAKLHHEMLPEGVNMISICTDAVQSPDAAKEVLSSVSAGFMTLLPNKDLQDAILKTVSAIPTTVFVDSAGRLVGDPIVGVPGRDAAAAYLKVINKLLSQ